MEYNIRYYLINMFELYNHKFLKEFKSTIYNNHIAFAFSFCPQKICNEDEDEHYSSLIFFSYPNTTGYNLDIINYLNKEENNDIIINLFDNVTIDNNIFGFIIDGIKIYSIDNCGINFTSNIKNETIKNNDILKENEKLELILTKDEYEKTNCTISYSLIITEPDYDEYNKYPNFILKENDVNEKKNFTKYSYEGKVGYFNVFINQGLTKNCGIENSDCNLCLKNDKLHCLLCKNNFNYIDNSKICEKMPISTMPILSTIPTTTSTITTIPTAPAIISTISTISTISIISTISTNIISSKIEFIETQKINSNIIGINENCNIEAIVDGKCPDIIITNEQLKEIYTYAKEKILNKNYTLESIFIPTLNVQFQLSTLEEQKYQNIYISSVDLNDCENMKIY